MPANKLTLKAIEAILMTDMGVSNIVRNNVLRDLQKDQETQCNEEQAAKILDISRNTLYYWRKGEWPKAPHPFWFHTWQNPAGDTRYDIEQLQMYTLLRKTVSTRQNPQPVITPDDLNNFTRIFGER